MTWSSWIVCAAVLAACQADRRPESGARETAPGDSDRAVRVAVQNLYVGADLATLLDAKSPAEVPALVAREFGNIEASYFPQRARSLAAEIAGDSPHLIGLQEVSLLRVQRPGDSAPGPGRRATDTVLDFLDILVDELGRAGVEYRPVASYQGMDIEVPSINTASGVDDIRLTDRGVILARFDVTANQPLAGTFSANLEVRVGGEEGVAVELTGGWSSVEATVGGQTLLFVTTHLESGDLAPDVQFAQARELLATLDTVSLPIVLVGDFSSTPDDAMTPTHAAVVAAGFTDVWAAARPDESGLTCCQAPDLRNVDSMLDRRLDFVFFRDAPTEAGRPAQQPFEARLIAATPASRTSSGLWPSDHAGLSAVITPAGP